MWITWILTVLRESTWNHMGSCTGTLTYTYTTLYLQTKSTKQCARRAFVARSLL